MKHTSSCTYFICFILHFLLSETESIISGGYKPPRNQVVRSFRHINQSPFFANWELGLRESVHQALLRERFPSSSNLHKQLLTAPFIGHKSPTIPFGDVVILARGQVYARPEGFLFKQDKYQNDCEGCHNFHRKCSHPDCDYFWDDKEELIALWTVKRLRHRDGITFRDDPYRYELEYTISPIKSRKVRMVNGQFDYNVPGHVFVIKSELTAPTNNNYRVHYKENYNHFRPGIVFGVTSNGYQQVLHSYPGFFTSFPRKPTSDLREIELYKMLVDSLHYKTSTTTAAGSAALNTGETIKSTTGSGGTKESLTSSTFKPSEQFTYKQPTQTTLIQLPTGQLVPLTDITVPSTVYKPPLAPSTQPIPSSNKVPTEISISKPTQVPTVPSPTPQVIYQNAPPTVITQYTKPPTKPPITMIHYYTPIEPVVPTKATVASTTKFPKPTKPTTIATGDSDEDFNLFDNLPTRPMQAITQKPLKKPYPASINDQLPPPDKSTDTTVPYVSSTSTVKPTTTVEEHNKYTSTIKESTTFRQTPTTGFTKSTTSSTTKDNDFGKTTYKGVSSTTTKPSTFKENISSTTISSKDVENTRTTFKDQTSTTIKDMKESTIEDHDTTKLSYGTTGTTVSLPDHGTTISDHRTSISGFTNSIFEHSTTLSDHGTTLTDHSSTLPDHSTTLSDHSSTLSDHSSTLLDHSSTFPTHGSTLSENSFESTFPSHGTTSAGYNSTPHLTTVNESPTHGTYYYHPSTNEIYFHPTKTTLSSTYLPPRTTPQYILTNINADGTITKTTKPLIKPTKPTISSDFLSDSDNNQHVIVGNSHKDYNEDDIFGNRPTLSTSSTSGSTTPAKQITQSDLALQLFGNNRKAKNVVIKRNKLAPARIISSTTGTTKATTENEPKIIYSNFYEASTLPPNVENENYLFGTTSVPTSQSYSTSISFEVNKHHLFDENVEYEPTVKAHISEIDNNSNYKVYKAELPPTSSTTTSNKPVNQSFDDFALQLINHARSIDYLHQASTTSSTTARSTSRKYRRQSKYARRRSYTPKAARRRSSRVLNEGTKRSL